MIDLYKYGNCASDLKGSGLAPCDVPLFGDLTGVALLKIGTKFDTSSDTLDAAAWKEKLKDLALFPYTGIYNFAQNTPENERATSSTGRLSIVRNGKPFYSFMFDKGSTLHKSLYDKRGNARWEVALIFEKGILFELSGSSLKGFYASMFDVETYKFLQGTDPEMSTAAVQLANAETFNKNHVFFTWDELGFDANDVNGVIDVNVAYVDAPAASTTFSVKVTAAGNNDYVITSLSELTNWALGGEQASATAISGINVDAATGKIEFTLDSALASGDTVAPYLIGTGSQLVAENAIGELYKGQAPEATV